MSGWVAWSWPRRFGLLLGAASGLALLAGCSSAGGTAPAGREPARLTQANFLPIPESDRGCLEKKGPTANPEASLEARALLAYLRELPQLSDGRVISGQYIGGGKYSGMKEIEKIYKQTGKWVAMVGNDYALMHAADTTGNRYLIDYWRQGGLVTVSFHALNPQNHRFGSVKNRKIELRDLFREGTKARENWIKDLDIAAAGLKELQEQGIVVLWRPFHEMNKDYFWWGNREVADFVQLWRETFIYLTKTKGLNNLLWVYSPYQAPDSAKYYPGDSYVDVVSLDAYETDPTRIQGYEDLAKLDKPFGFGEYGPSGNLFLVVPVVEKNVDYHGIFRTILRRFPKTSFLHAWGGGWGYQNHRNVPGLMNDRDFITRERLRWRSVCR